MGTLMGANLVGIFKVFFKICILIISIETNFLFLKKEK